MSQPTPFTAAYDAIWAALRQNNYFKGLVKTANQNDFSDRLHSHVKREVQAAQLPEVTLLQGPFLMKPTGSNSKTAQLSKTYNLVAVTDSIQVDSINEVEFAVCAALFWGDLEGAHFNGFPFIQDWHITAGSDGTTGVRLPTAGDSARGIERLSSILSISVEMYVQRSLLPR